MVSVLFPGPVTPVSKFITPVSTLSAPPEAKVGVAPALTTVVEAVDWMVKLYTVVFADKSLIGPDPLVTIIVGVPLVMVKVPARVKSVLEIK